MDDPLLEIAVPMQFIIGENAVMTSLDDIEDFRERLTKTETALVVVGGADDKLVISNLKKRLECLTQSMVDRCVADEIFSFLSNILTNYSDDGSGFASTDQMRKVTIISSQANSSLSNNPFATPKPKKKASKKRATPGGQPQFGPDGKPLAGVLNGVFGDASQTPKPPPKRKRPPPKPKTPLVPMNGTNPMVIPNSMLLSAMTTQQIFPNPGHMWSQDRLVGGETQPKQLYSPSQNTSKFILASGNV